MKLQGKLVRILGGQEWELLTEEGHAGLQKMLRAFEDVEVTISITKKVKPKKKKARAG